MSPNNEPRPGERQEPLGAEGSASHSDETAPARPNGSERGVEIEQVVQSTAGVERHERIVRDKAGLEHRERIVRDLAAERRMILVKAIQLTWLFIGVVEVLFGLRVLLKLIGANPANDFARLIYDSSSLFLAPFIGLTGSPSSGGVILEVPALIAMIAYALLGWVIVRLIVPLFEVTSTQSSSRYDRYRD
ncbi:MAG: hypothetical protein HY675_09860 [Chloroflexi bacterium]|nr:hypothetical protein [Chloroflexota bacterium]